MGTTLHYSQTLPGLLQPSSRLTRKLLPVINSSSAMCLTFPGVDTGTVLQVKLTQDVSLPGMMTAITEVEVSKESKMRKIEETERVKASLLAQKTG